VRREAAIASAEGTQPFGIGFQLWAVDNQPGVIEAAAEANPTVVSLSFGDAGKYRDVFKDSLIAKQVNNLDDVKRAEDEGVDIVVAQGTDAGGHTGYVGTLPLLQAVLQHTDKPVVAAGGIGTGRGIAAVLAAGAQAAWIGTRFLAATEAANTPRGKKRVIDAEQTDTVLTSVFDRALGLDWPARYPGRALRNETSDAWHGRDDQLDDATKQRIQQAQRDEDYDRAVVYAGQAAAFVTAEQSAQDIIEGLADEAERCLRAAAGLYD
jgi:nitronate monooxygenase